MKRLLRILSISIATIVLPVALVAVALLSFEFTIPLDADRERIGGALSDALGRPVTLSGSLRAYTGPRAGVEAAGVRIGANPAAPEGLSIDIGRLVLRVHLIPLLSRTIRVSMLSAEDVLLCAAARADRAAPQRKTKEPGQAPQWRLNAVDRLDLERIRFTRSAACDATEALAELESLKGAAPPDGRVALATHARIGEERVAVQFQGPSLAAMLDRRSTQEPFEVTAEIAGAKAAAKGFFNFADLSGQGDVELDADQFTRILRPLGAPFKDFGPLRVRAHVTASRTEAQIRIHEAEVSPGRLHGEATWAWTGPHPSLQVEAGTEKLDVMALASWLEKSIDPALIVPGRLTRNTISGVRSTEGRVKLAVDTLSAGPVTLSSTALHGDWKTGAVDVSLNGFLDKAPLAAKVRMSLGETEHAFNGTASVRDLSLAPTLPVTGRIRVVEAKFSTRGTLGEALLRSLRASVTAREAALSIPGDDGKRVPLNVDRVAAQWGERDTLTLDAKGTLSGDPLQVRVVGAGATALWQGRPWPLRANVAAGPLQGQAKGSVALLDEQVTADLDLTIGGPRLGAFAWGNAALAKLPLEASGSVSVKPDAWSVKLGTARLGNTRARLSAGGSRPVAARPMKADIAFDMLDLNELVASGGASSSNTELLPQNLSLPAAELTVRAARVALRGRVAEQVGIEASTPNGGLTVSRFGARVSGAEITGRLALDLTGAVARVSADGKATGVTEKTLGDALSAKNIRLEIGAIELSGESTGNRSSDLAGNAAIDINLRNSTFSLPVGAKKTLRSGNVATARLTATPGQPVRLALEGELEKLPVDLEASSAPLARLLQPADAPVTVNGRIAGIDVELAGNIPGPRLAEHPLTVRIRADRLNRFDALTHHDFPATGPVAADLALHGLTGNTPHATVDIRVGESRLSGKLAKHAAAGRARWAAELSGPRLRLEDFGSADWVHPDSKPAPGKKEPAAPGKAGMAARRERAGLIYEQLRHAMRQFDLQLKAKIDDISSGAESFGGAEANVTLDAGRLRAAPFVIRGPHGKLVIALDADYGTDDAPFQLDFDLEQFNYGRLVQSIKPTLDATGKLSAQLHLSGRGKAGEIARSLDGRVGFIVFPSSSQGLQLLELWGGGLLRTVGRSLDSNRESKLNCGVATFDVDRGNVKSRALMIDSTHVRAAGELKIDLATGALDGLIMPKTKRAELFSAKAPLTIGGTLNAPKVTVATTSVLVTAARYYYFAYAFLFDAASGGNLAANGSPDCIAAYERLSKTPAPAKATTDKGP